MLKGKAKLRYRKERIIDDLTDKKRRTEWLTKVEVVKRRVGEQLKTGYVK